MTFTAQIKQFSALWHHWRAGNRVGGVLHGAQFFWEPGNLYRTQPLEPASLEALRAHPDIVLEATDVPPPVALNPSSPPAPTAMDSKPVPIGVTPPRRR